MHILKTTTNLFLPMALVTGTLVLSGCSVNVKDHDNDGNGKVDISTPVEGFTSTRRPMCATPDCPYIRGQS